MQNIFSFKCCSGAAIYPQDSEICMLLDSSLLKVSPPSHLLGEWLSCRACEFPTLGPKSRRTAASNYISILEADGGCHDRLCCSERRCGRYYRATKGHSDHRSSSSQQSRKRTPKCVVSSLRSGTRWHHQECREGNPPMDGCRGLQPRKEQRGGDAENEYGGTKTYSGACIGAWNTAMCPMLTLPQRSARFELELMAEQGPLISLPWQLPAVKEFNDILLQK